MCNILAKPHSDAIEETWNTLVTKFSSEDHVAVSAAAAAAVLTGPTDAEDVNAHPWRHDDMYAFEVLFGVTRSRSALTGPRNDGQLFTHLQFMIHTDIGREEFDRGMTASWRRIVDEPDAFPPDFWQLLLPSSVTALGEKCRPVCVGTTRARPITAGAMRQWRSWLEVKREARQFGVAVS